LKIQNKTSFKERPTRILETTVNELYFFQTYGYSLSFDLTNNTRLKQRPAQLQLKTNFGYNIIKKRPHVIRTRMWSDH